MDKCRVIIVIQLVALIALSFGIRGVKMDNMSLKNRCEGLNSSNEYLLEKIETMDDWISPKRSGELQ